MGFNAATGQYTPDDPTDVGQQMTGLLNTNNAYMKQAGTQGLKAANQRGLLNTTMGVQAGQAARVAAAAPMASQMAQQAQNEKLQGQQIASTEKIAQMNVAANDREKSASHVAAVDNAYNEAFRTVAAQNELPADVRDKYLAQIGKIRDSSMNLVEQLWGINLQWDEPAAATT